MPMPADLFVPRRLTPLLAGGSAVLFAAYLALVAATIFFATAETRLAASIRGTETRIGTLETEYYDAIGKISDADVSAMGYRAPVKTQYVSAEGAQAVTMAATGVAAP